MNTRAIERVWRIAASEANQSGDTQIEPLHFLLGILKFPDVAAQEPAQAAEFATEIEALRQLFEQVGIDPQYLRRTMRQQIARPRRASSAASPKMSRSAASRSLSARTEERLQIAGEKARLISCMYLLQSLLHDPAVTDILRRTGVDVDQLGHALDAQLDSTIELGEPEISQLANDVSSLQDVDISLLREPAEEEISTLLESTAPIFAQPVTHAGQTARSDWQRLRLFYDMSQALGSAVTLDQLFRVFAEQLQLVFADAQRGAILMQTGDRLVLKEHWPTGSAPVSQSLAQRARDRREAFVWNPRTADAADSSQSMLVRHLNSAMYAPLIAGDTVLGVVVVDMQEPEQVFAEADCDLLRAFAAHLATHITNHMLREQLLTEQMQRERFERYFSPAVAERILQTSSATFGGARINPVTILMSDIRGFTVMSAKMEPPDVVRLLNDMFYEFVEIVFKYNGTIDKFIGDAMLAVFGSPQPDDQQWQHAVQAAIEMQAAIAGLHARWRNANLPVCEVGIGIHTGEVVHGMIGSRQRMEYTIIGDAVNQTNRYCSGAAGGEVLISEDVYAHVFGMVHVDSRKLLTKHPEREPERTAYLITGLA